MALLVLSSSLQTDPPAFLVLPTVVRFGKKDGSWRKEAFETMGRRKSLFSLARASILKAED